MDLNILDISYCPNSVLYICNYNNYYIHMGIMKVQEIVRKVLQTPLFLQRNACGIAQPRLPVCTHTHYWRSMLERLRIHLPGTQHWDCAVRLFYDFIVAALPKKNDALLQCLLLVHLAKVCYISFFYRDRFPSFSYVTFL